MVENRQIFHVEFKIIYVNTYIKLKEMKLNSLALNYGLYIVTSFQRVHY